MTGRRVAMKVYASVFPEYPLHLQQSHGHEAHIRSHAVRMGVSRAFDGFHELRKVVRDFVHPRLLNVILPRPPVLKGRAGGEAVGRGVKIPVLVEGRVGGDEVNGV